MLINTFDNNLFFSKANSKQNLQVQKVQKTGANNLQSFTGTSVYEIGGKSNIDSSKLASSFLANVSFAGASLSKSSQNTNDDSVLPKSQTAKNEYDDFQAEDLFSSDKARGLANKKNELIAKYREIQAEAKKLQGIKKNEAEDVLAGMRKEIRRLDLEIITIEEDALFGSNW